MVAMPMGYEDVADISGICSIPPKLSHDCRGRINQDVIVN
jgi:hypothetical protein